MRVAVRILAAVLLLHCGNEIVKQTISEARKKPKLKITIYQEDLALRKTIEKEVEQEHIGTVLDVGSGNGHMDLTVEVDETVTTIPKIRAILSRQGLLERSSIVVIP